MREHQDRGLLRQGTRRRQSRLRPHRSGLHHLPGGKHQGLHPSPLERLPHHQTPPGNRCHLSAEYPLPRKSGSRYRQQPEIPPGIVGRKDSYRTFVIHNAGTLPLTNLTATVQSGDSKDFVIQPLKKTSIAPGKTIILKVRFAPTRTGKRNSQLRIGSNDANENPYTFGLTANGLEKN
ncbi:MAG: DUF1573 domain-containing protein [Verrucomicrobiaceae bacterium]|nr:MAG: DUF1573 domain-containing protein [Verrucomicrobiaceae bacterium]